MSFIQKTLLVLTVATPLGAAELDHALDAGGLMARKRIENPVLRAMYRTLAVVEAAASRSAG